MSAKAIVVAWIDFDGFELADELERFDGVNWRRKTKMIARPHALCWAMKPGASDLTRAREYAKSKDVPLVKVYRFDSESDFLNLARERIMQEFRQQKQRGKGEENELFK